MPPATYFNTKVPFLRNMLYTLTRYTTHASARRYPFAWYIVTDVCIHNTEYINNYELVTGEAHYSMVLLSLHYGLGLVNLCGLGLVNLCNLEFQDFKNFSFNDERKGD